MMRKPPPVSSEMWQQAGGQPWLGHRGLRPAAGGQQATSAAGRGTDVVEAPPQADVPAAAGAGRWVVVPLLRLDDSEAVALVSPGATTASSSVSSSTR